MSDAATLLTALPYWVAALAAGYLFGSIPFGVVFTRLAGAGDVRAIGSGNIGATNVLRTGRKDIAALTLVCDVLKGTLPVLLADRYGGEGAAIAAAGGAFFGHLFPVWLAFRGGKGVATLIGVLIAFSWPAAMGFCVIWLAVAATTRYASLASLIASAGTPGLMWYFGDAGKAALFAVLAILVWIMHRSNIARLAAGTESRIGAAADKTR